MVKAWSPHKNRSGHSGMQDEMYVETCYDGADSEEDGDKTGRRSCGGTSPEITFVQCVRRPIPDPRPAPPRITTVPHNERHSQSQV